MTNPYDRNKSLKKVLSGDFPAEVVKKMNRKNLESFVLKLVECSSDVGAKNAKNFTALYRGLCLKQINKPEWWPSEKIIEQSLTTDGKYFMQVLRFLVYKCCEFFKKPCANLNGTFIINDENCERGIKRRYSEAFAKVPTKRRTLLPKNVGSVKSLSPCATEKHSLKDPVIPLTKILFKPKPNPLTQDVFLTAFGLQNIFYNNGEENEVPSTTSNSIKFTTCSIIPFSSDLGRELMKRDNHKFPEQLQHRKLERLEWYINKPYPRSTDNKYEVTYHRKRGLTFHNFKFPKRQIGQHPSDFEYQKQLLYSKPLKVVLKRENLEMSRLKVLVSKVIIKQESDDRGTSISENKCLLNYNLRPRGRKKTL